MPLRSVEACPTFYLRMAPKHDRQIKPAFRNAWMRVFAPSSAAIVLLAAWLCASPFLRETQAQDGQPVEVAPAISANRFLFVFDTSTAMNARQPNMNKVLEEVINSGGNGQLRNGDTLGVWTFSQEVHSEFPLQTWGADPRDLMAPRIEGLLRKQPYTGMSRLDKALQAMLEVMRHSDFITVMIVSSGESRMKGTPFDKEINDLYQQYLRESKGREGVVVTILQANGGKIVRYAVTAPPWPTVIPKVPLTSNPPPVVATPRPAVPSLIITKPPPPAVKSEVTVVPVETPPAPSVSPAPAPSLPPTQIITPLPVEITAAGPTPAPPVQPAPKPASPPSEIPPPIATSPPPAISKPPASPPQTPANDSATVTAITPRASYSTNRALAFAATESTGRSNFLLIAGATLALIGVLLIVMMLRRERTPSGPSFITRSMGNRRK